MRDMDEYVKALDIIAKVNHIDDDPRGQGWAGINASEIEDSDLE